MIFSRKYNLVNNITGWGVFVIALLTYWLTLEPTASYWDCGEFIIQADKLEIGHPPGNPIFMLTARFFANFAFGDQQLVALMVNAMSGLLSALTILLLFWTVTHLVRRLLVKDEAKELSLSQYLVVMGSGVCGALAYAWSDTFWFSAVEGEVYAFSSFCTALVFWLILKWENRADEPHSDRYLILIAYIIGVSIAVHLLNLLCIPAIVLVYSYRRFPDMNLKKSLLALAVGFAIIVLVLYGLVPGFIEVAGYFELLAVNTLGMSFNSGMIIYTVLTLGCFVWALYELYTQRSGMRIRISFLAGVLLSGILFIGSGVWFGLVLLIVLAGVLFTRLGRKIPVRWLNVAMWSIAVIFVGYSSYALILLRSNANTPMNQNSPDNVFALSSYLNREQYGDTPLLYGQTYQSQPRFVTQNFTNPGYDYPELEGVVEQDIVDSENLKGDALYARGVKGGNPAGLSGFLSSGEKKSNEELAARGGDFYALYDYEAIPVMNPELNILLPRIHSSIPEHQKAYEQWVPGLEDDAETVELHSTDASSGEETELLERDYAMDSDGKYATNSAGLMYHRTMTAKKPTFGQNMEFFFNYQLNHMYWRYFLWNFAGRQNDLNNQNGEKDLGNWITGIPALDNSRLGDQSLLPPELGSENKGHNVYYMLPLLLGIMGLLWQAFRGKRGIEQFWVVFFLFFMTGIAIVLYLNQTPLQPRERDYAYAGSFYAFAIWIGMGVAAIYSLLHYLMERRAAKASASEAKSATPELPAQGKKTLVMACVAAAIGLLIPLQMVSQTWDDHDRSGRYAARDYAINYLNSLEPNAIVFCNGDNDTFPLWYAQEVEGVRPDVKIINLSYLSSTWYANQQRLQTYKAAPVPMTAKEADLAYDRLAVVRTDPGQLNEDQTDIQRMPTDDSTPTPLLTALKEIYDDNSFAENLQSHTIRHSSTFIPVDAATVKARGLVPAGVEPLSEIPVQLSSMSQSTLLMLDIIATNAAQGWKRPIYWASTVGSEYYRDFLPYVRATGMAFQLVPYQAQQQPDTDIAYKVIMTKYLWGGADNYDDAPYFDETAGRMLAATRQTVLDLARTLAVEGADLKEAGHEQQARAKFAKAANVLNLYEKRLMGPARALSFSDYYTLGVTWCSLGEYQKDAKAMDRGLKVLAEAMNKFAANVKYANDLGNRFGFLSSNGMVYGLDVTTSYETTNILFSYFELVKAYNQFVDIKAHGYDAEACPAETMEGKKLLPATLKVLRSAGISEKLAAKLRKYMTDYDTLLNKQGGGTGGDMALTQEDMEAFARYLAQYAEVVVEMQGKSPEEYAAASQQERDIDSMFISALQQYQEMGGDMKLLEQYEIFDKVDAERSVRLGSQYSGGSAEEVAATVSEEPASQQ